MDPRDYLSYDPDTGVFTNTRSRRGHAFKGRRAGTAAGRYRYIILYGKRWAEHRLAFLFMGEPLPEEVDHINGDCHDNRWVNLRPADRTANMRNATRRKDNNSGVTGVHRFRNGKWRAQLGKKHLGYFDTFKQAVAARKHAEKEAGYSPRHGEPK